MNALRVLFLTLVFAFGILFLVQNTQVLDNRISLALDLWWVQLSTPYMAFYIFIFLALMLGIIFGAVTFFPGNKELRENLKLLRIKIKGLTQEVIELHKKEDIHEDGKSEKEVPEPAEETLDLPEDPTLDKDTVIKTGGSSGKTALVGVFALFVLLTAFYFYIDQKISSFQGRMDMVIEDSLTSAELAAKAERETLVLQEDISNLSGILQEQEKEISQLRRLPQDTMDYLTMMKIDEYAANINQLMETAGTEADREMLAEILKSLQKAMDHYADKAD